MSVTKVPTRNDVYVAIAVLTALSCTWLICLAINQHTAAVADLASAADCVGTISNRRIKECEQDADDRQLRAAVARDRAHSLFNW